MELLEEVIPTSTTKAFNGQFNTLQGLALATKSFNQLLDLELTCLLTPMFPNMQSKQFQMKLRLLMSRHITTLDHRHHPVQDSCQARLHLTYQVQRLTLLIVLSQQLVPSQLLHLIHLHLRHTLPVHTHHLQALIRIQVHTHHLQALTLLQVLIHHLQALTHLQVPIPHRVLTHHHPNLILLRDLSQNLTLYSLHRQVLLVELIEIHTRHLHHRHLKAIQVDLRLYHLQARVVPEKMK